MGAPNPAGRRPRSLRSPLGSSHGEGPFSVLGAQRLELKFMLLFTGWERGSLQH